jgi:hypothetical protein
VIREVVKACEEFLAPGVSSEGARFLAEVAIFFGAFASGSAIAWVGRVVLRLVTSRNASTPPAARRTASPDDQTQA